MDPEPQKGVDGVQTLVLDVGYVPHTKTSWENAIVWVLEQVAEVVEEYPDRYIRTPNWKIKMPSVVRLLKPVPRKKAVKFSRSNLWIRDGGKCQYCGSKVAMDNFTYEHVIPRVQGGTTCWENVVVSCVTCNQRKAGLTPQQAGMRLLTVPVKPKKLPHVPKNLQYRKGQPESWKNWLQSEVYWSSELEK